MIDHAMPRDMRVRGNKGTYQTRLVSATPATDGSADAGPANGARVALIVSYRTDTPADGVQVRVGYQAGASLLDYGVLSQDRASMVFALAEYGDCVLMPPRLLATGAVAGAVVQEVVWAPTE